MSDRSPNSPSAKDTLSDRLQGLLKFAVCPENRTVLRLAPPALVTRLNTLIAQRSLRDRSATLLTDPLQALLVRADNTLAYPVRHDIPVLLISSAILLHDDDRSLL